MKSVGMNPSEQELLDMINEVVDNSLVSTYEHIQRRHSGGRSGGHSLFFGHYCIYYMKVTLGGHSPIN